LVAAVGAEKMVVSANSDTSLAARFVEQIRWKNVLLARHSAGTFHFVEEVPRLKQFFSPH